LLLLSGRPQAHLYRNKRYTCAAPGDLFSALRGKSRACHPLILHYAPPKTAFTFIRAAEHPPSEKTGDKPMSSNQKSRHAATALSAAMVTAALALGVASA